MATVQGSCSCCSTVERVQIETADLEAAVESPPKRVTALLTAVLAEATTAPTAMSSCCAGPASSASCCATAPAAGGACRVTPALAPVSERCCATADCCPADKTCCGTDGVAYANVQVPAPCCVVAGCCPEKPDLSAAASKKWWLRIAFGLAIFTVLWNVIEGLLSLAFGVKDESISLSIFGIDSFVEVFSAFVVLWRLRGELFGSDLTQQDSARRLQKVRFMCSK
jgi:hypothetical protein